MADGTETGADANAETVTASVIGGSGFTGGELLRLLAGHPNFDITEVTSRSKAGKSVGSVHPPLRGSDLRFTEPDDLESVDVLFAATPHGVSMGRIDDFFDIADTVVDLSADFRLESEAQYEEWVRRARGPGIPRTGRVRTSRDQSREPRGSGPHRGRWL